MITPDLLVGKQLTVGVGFPLCLGLGPTQVRGSAYIEGPVLIGNPISYPIPNTADANLMVARCINVEALPPPPSIFKVSSRGLPPTPLDVMLGDPTGPVGVSIFTGPMQYSVQSAASSHVTLAYNLLSSSILRTGPSFDFGAKIFTGAKAEFGVDTNFAVALNAAPLLNTSSFNIAFDQVAWNGETLTKKKDFDIPHPTKDGWRLTHACVEGPEAAVYIRGRVKDKFEIKLPEYWKGLVDIETVTVNLTAIGSHQDVIVKEWDDEKVYLQSKSGTNIDCFYHIMAERIDTEKLIPEYEGAIEDYPGDNSQRSIVGYHYDR